MRYYRNLSANKVEMLYQQLAATSKGTHLIRPLSVLAVSAIVLAAAPTTQAGAADGDELFRLNTTTVSGTTGTARWNPCGKPISYTIDARYLHVKPARRAVAAADLREGIRQLSAATGLRFRQVKDNRLPLPTRRKWTAAKADVRIVFMSPSRRKESTNFLPHNTLTGVGRFAGRTSWLPLPAKTADGQRAVRIGKAVVAIDADQFLQHPWGYGPGPVTGDLILHELGHVVGLDHVSNPAQIMYGGRISEATYATASYASYQPGDRQGLALVGHQQGCLKPAKSRPRA